MLGIRAGAAFDGEAAVPGGALVLVEGGQILGVEPRDAAAPQGCEVVDLPGGTVLPGLVDTHVHLCADGTDGTLGRILDPSDEQMQSIIAESLRQHLAAGVTTVRDLGDRRFALLDWRASARPDGPYPTVVTAGPPITSIGGHCANMGGQVAGEQALHAAVHERVQRGVDVVKVMASGGFTTLGTEVMRCQFTLEELRLLVEQSHAAGLPITAHAHGRPAVHLAMEAGFDGIEHCSFLTDKGVVLTDQDAADLAEAGILVCPTLGYAGATAVPPSTVALLEKLGLTVADMQQASRRGVAQLHAAGVRLISGSDGGISSGKPHGILAASVASLVDSGVSAVAALTSATCLAAQACGVGDRKGRLRPGYDADLLLLDGDPMADIDALTALRAVFVAGQRATGKP